MTTKKNNTVKKKEIKKTVEKSVSKSNDKTQQLMEALKKQAESANNVVKNTPSAKTSVSSVSNVGSANMMKRNLVPMLLSALLVLAIAAYYSRTLFVAAVVNGQPITRYELDRELEKQSGKAALDSIITKKLVVQEGKRQNIKVTKEEVEAEITKIEDSLKGRGQSLEQLLSVQNLTRADLVEQLTLTKIADKLIGTIEVTDEEIDKYFEDNKSFLPKGSTKEEYADTIKQQLDQEKQSAKIQDLVARLKSEAKISNWLFAEDAALDLSSAQTGAPSAAPSPTPEKK